MNAQAKRKFEISAFLRHWHILKEKLDELSLHQESVIKQFTEAIVEEKDRDAINHHIGRLKGLKSIYLLVDELQEELEEGIEKAPEEA